MTLHSLGLKTLRKNHSRFKIEISKNYRLFNILKSERRDKFSKIKGKKYYQIMYSILDLNDLSRIFFTDDFNELTKYAQTSDKNIDQSPLVKGLWRDFKIIRDEQEQMIDFTDMLYLPVKKGYNIPIDPHYLMVDEAQDLSLIQHMFIDKLINKDSLRKWVAVGDPNQAIYGFAGAFTKSFEKFSEKDNVKTLPLNYCYRCGSKIVEQANEVFEDILQSPENIHEGYVFKELDGTDLDQIAPSDMIICRNKKPLINLYFVLINKGLSANILGEDILTPISRILKSNKKSILSAITTDLKTKADRLRQDPEKAWKAFKIEENRDIIITLVTSLGLEYTDKGEKLLTYLDTIFNKEVRKKDVTLCTIHKSKGLEAEKVYILNEDLIPSKFAKSKESLQQEENLRYVARTRAKKELNYLTL